MGVAPISLNVLLDTAKGTKLTDFRTSRTVDEDMTMTNAVLTYQWMAPEVILGTKYSFPADIYSFGIILSEICTHVLPYARLSQRGSGWLTRQCILNQVSNGELYPSFDGDNIPTWVKDIAMQCLRLNDKERPTTFELVVC
ncbi:kinase [Thraustotheca clavata]|uniref:Kinase n=1 Tax=Thraustotheca clavata TaxID=74557 RepID=A0A1V9ZQ38_9STRA|nr:kinase [Thraustotheca clavata]